MSESERIFCENVSHKINDTNTKKLKEKYNLSLGLIDEYVTDVLVQGKFFVDELEEHIKNKGHKAFYEDVCVLKEKRIFDTTQNNIVIPTKHLIKVKNTDFRVLLCVSVISNCDNSIKCGLNKRYVSMKKVDKNMDNLCQSINISPSQFKKHLRNLLKNKSDEFKIVDREYKGQVIKCYEINYEEGGFVTIPYNKIESILIGGSNNCIKLYANLLWLCQNDGKFVEKHISQEVLLELMGLSINTTRIITIATKWLEGANLIKTEKRWESETFLDADGLPKGSSPKSKIYYSIVAE